MTDIDAAARIVTTGITQCWCDANSPGCLDCEEDRLTVAGEVIRLIRDTLHRDDPGASVVRRALDLSLQSEVYPLGEPYRRHRVVGEWLGVLGD